MKLLFIPHKETCALHLTNPNYKGVRTFSVSKVEVEVEEVEVEEAELSGQNGVIQRLGVMIQALSVFFVQGPQGELLNFSTSNTCPGCNWSKYYNQPTVSL